MQKLSERQREIISVARAQGQVNVDDLAAQFEVTPQTIRKDLNDICASGLMRRTHGGAVVVASMENLEYDARRLLAQEEKRHIGIAAAALIPNNCSVFIGIGTTTEEVARNLLNKKNILVVTNNINVANMLRSGSEVDVIIAGGIVRRTDGGVVGDAAVDFLTQFKFDFAIVGTSAIDEDGSLLDYDLREVKVAQAILNNARHVILVSDTLKLDRNAPIRIAHLTQIQTFVTDTLRSNALRNLCRSEGVTLVETMATASQKSS
ncbi:MAG: DeoR/GlpR family DNA-binding transcription regulator [Magnetospiraceae bacterium]